jgi:hypothetical protein
VRAARLLRRVGAMGALAAMALPASAQASCALVDSTMGLGQILNASQLREMQGEVVNGKLVRGSAPPAMVRLTGCSETLTTTVKLEPVTMVRSGTTLVFNPWLITVNGNTLGIPQDISQTGYDFLGNATLGILLVPANLPATLTPGDYAGTTLFTFTD